MMISVPPKYHCSLAPRSSILALVKDPPAELVRACKTVDGGDPKQARSGGVLQEARDPKVPAEADDPRRVAHGRVPELDFREFGVV